MPTLYKALCWVPWGTSRSTSSVLLTDLDWDCSWVCWILLSVLGKEDGPLNGHLFHCLPSHKCFLGLSTCTVSLIPPHDSLLVSYRGFDKMPQPFFMTTFVEIPEEDCEHWQEGCELPHFMWLWGPPCGAWGIPCDVHRGIWGHLAREKVRAFCFCFVF